MEIPDYIYEETEDHREREEQENSAYLATAQQHYEEIAYQTELATSYPRNLDAIFAENWLRGQGVW